MAAPPDRARRHHGARIVSASHPLGATPYAWATADVRDALTAGLTAAGFDLDVRLDEPSIASRQDLFGWLLTSTAAIGIEATMDVASKAMLSARLVRRGAHVVVPLGGDESSCVVVVGGGTSCRLVGREGEVECHESDIVDWLTRSTVDASSSLGRIFSAVPRGAKALERLSRADPIGAPSHAVFSFELDGAAALWRRLAHAGAGSLLTYLLLATLATFAVVALAAFALGSAAVDGLVDRDRVIGFSVVSVAAAPLAFWTTSLRERLTLIGAAAVKRRLLEGTFSVDERTLRTEGYGSTLARLGEAGVIERTGVAPLVGVLVPLSSLSIAAWLFARSARGIELLAVEIVAIVASLYVAFRAVTAYERAYGKRLALTEDLVDKIVGHRTRSVQQPTAQRHRAEDGRLAEYTRLSEASDGLAAASALAPRAWLFAAGVVVARSFVDGASAFELTLPVVGTLLVATGLSDLAAVVSGAAAWRGAWLAIHPLFVAGGARETTAQRPALDGASRLPTVVAASAVRFRYRSGGRDVLRDTSLRLADGDRVLLEGPSGGGKTTLAKLIAGELRPTAGALLVCGFDRWTVSDTEWRTLVASAPQFHENHVFSNTFAFNVDPLGGASGLRAEALEVCEELGLGPLLAKMPAGANQILGETGWQLSHGERSRVFVARALLQKSGLVILDESFGALDPVTLKLVVDCVRRRARTLIVIAHV